MILLMIACPLFWPILVVDLLAGAPNLRKAIRATDSR